MAITRRSFMRVAAGFAAASAARSALAADSPRRQPNILFIMTDEQPLHTLGCYGNTLGTTPNVDRLASEGVRFSAFHIGAYACSPSRATFLTGLHSHLHGVVSNDIQLDPSLPTLGSLAAQAGYDTAYIGKSHLGGNMYRTPQPSAKHPQGTHVVLRRVASDEDFKFEWVEGGQGEDGPQLGFAEWTGGWTDYHEYLRGEGLSQFLEGARIVGNHNIAPSGPEGTHIYSLVPEEHHEAAFSRKRAVEFLGKRGADSPPFCLVVSFFGPHSPVAPPRPWDEKFSLDQVSLPANHRDDLASKPPAQRNKNYKLDQWTDEQFLDYKRRYYGYCAYIDDQIGRILEALEETGQAGDTMVIFTTDHGDMVGAHGFINKIGNCGYDELMRVPFVVRWPGSVRAGVECGALVSSVDVLPTLIDLAGLPSPERLSGRSFRALLEQGGDTFRAEVVCNNGGNSLMLFDGRWKYVCITKTAGALGELYDVKSDPGEMVNLHDDPAHAAKLEEMRERLAAWLRETGHPYAEPIVARMRAPRAPENRGGGAAALRPKLTQLELVDGKRLRVAYEWEALTDLEAPGKARFFCQFLNKRYGTQNDIAFRLTPSVELDGGHWKQGAVVKIGPLEVEIPATAGPGQYEIKLGATDAGLQWKPNVNGRGANADVVGRMALRGEAGRYTSAEFEAAN